MQTYKHNLTGEIVTAVQFRRNTDKQIFSWCRALVAMYYEESLRKSVGVILQYKDGKEYKSVVIEDDYIVNNDSWYEVIKHSQFLQTYTKVRQ